MKKVEPCREWEHMLVLTAFEDLPTVDQVLLMAHIKLCPACSHARAKYLETSALLQSLPPVEPLSESADELLRLWSKQEAQDNVILKMTGKPLEAPRLVLPKRLVNTLAMIAILLLSSLTSISSGGFFQGVSYNTNSLGGIQATPTAYSLADSFADSFYNAVRSRPYRDSLSGNEITYWETYSHTDGACFSNDGEFRVQAWTPDKAHLCIARGTNYTEFAYEAQMKIIEGNSAGLFFRANQNSDAYSYYAFMISIDGSYMLRINSTISAVETRVLRAGHSKAIKTGLNQSNSIATIVQADKIALYANDQLITIVTDTTLRQGSLGFIALGERGHTEVNFISARIWIL